MAKFTISVLLTAVFTLSVCVMVRAQTTEFTFQGTLTSGGQPANGQHDFEFRLYDALTGGTQIGGVVTRSAVQVNNGSFAVPLDFGSQFPGADRYLEIKVRQAGAPNWETLAPRQRVASQPYAVRALDATNAGSAATAANASALGGIPAAQYVLTIDSRLSDARQPLPGNANYIQNNNAAAQTASFWITGAAKAFSVSGDIVNGGTVNADLLRTGVIQHTSGARSLFTDTATNSTLVGIGTASANTGASNTFVGWSSGAANTDGARNSFFGASSGLANTTGADNAFFGNLAGGDTVGGSRNSLFGATAGRLNTTGSDNSFFGWQAGRTNTTGTGNLAIGAFADLSTSNLTNASAIGFRALATQSNSLVLGSVNGVNGATADTNVGIGTTAPTQRLHVVGNSLFTGNLSVSGSITGTLNVSSLTGVLGVANGGTGLAAPGANNNFLRSNGTAWVSGPMTAADIVGGSTNYIQNSTATQASANFNISGSGTLGGTLSASVVSAATQFNLGTQRLLAAPGTGNVFAGIGAGAANTTGTGNAAFGSDAGTANTTGSNNAFFGEGAGAANTTGFSNSFFGRAAGSATTIGDSNSFFGNGAGAANVAGTQNTFVGRNAGNSNGGGSGNSVFGHNANVGSANLTNATAIGSSALVTQNNSLVLGSITGVNGATASTSVGIGTTAPSERLHVVGNGLFSGNLSVGGTITGSLSVSNLTGVLGAANGGTGINSPGAAGSFLRSTGTAWAASPILAADIPAGSSSYIQNQNAAAQASANFNISGSGTLGGSLTAASATITGAANAGSANITGALTAASGTFTGLASAATVNATSQFNFGGQRILSAAGTSNLFAGIGAGAANTTGASNSFVGPNSGAANTTGDGNSFVGANAGNATTTGLQNTFVGRNAGGTNTTGSGNTTLGSNADVGSAALTNATAIGANSSVTQSNSLVLGSINGVNGATADTNVGIGTTAPAQKLHVVGNTQITGNLTVGGTITGTISVPATSITGVLAAANGGTGLSTPGTAGSYLRSNGTQWTSSAIQAADIPAGSTSYIQNQNAGPQSSANFNISGSGTLGGSLTAASASVAGGVSAASATLTGALTAGSANVGGNLTVDTNTLVVDAANNRVGIGTATPTSTVGVAGESAAAISMERRTAPDTAGNQLTVSAGGAAVGGSNNAGGDLILTSGTSTGTGGSNIALRTASPGTPGTTDNAPTTKLFIAAAGNVGIGTTSPSERLSVAGNASVSGNLTVGGSITGSLNVSNISGVLPTANGGTGLSAPGAAGSFLRSNGTNWTTSTINASDIPSGSGNYIQNQNAGAQASANFNISGSGTLGGTLTAAGGAFSGAVTSASATVSGSVNAGSAAITNALTAGSAAVGGNLTVDTNTLVVDAANNRVGIGTATPTNALSLAGETAQTIALERRTAASSAGSALTVASGGATSGGSNLNGGDLVLASGTSTGTGGSNIVFRTATPAATGTADNSPSTKMQIAGSGSVAIGANPTNDTRLTVTRSGVENVDNNALSVTNATTGSDPLLSPAKFTAKFSNTGAVLGDSSGVQVDNLSTNIVKDGLVKNGLVVQSTGAFTGDTGAATKNYGLTVTVAGADENYAATFSGGNVGIGTTAPQDALTVNGMIRVSTLGSAGATALCQNASNQIASCSSSLRYKTNITPYLPGLAFIRQLRPIAFDWVSGGLKDVGFGAEDVARVDPRFVTYNAKGEVEGVKYDRLSVAFVNAFTEQQRQIEEQKKQLDEQNKKLDAQQKQIDALVRALCTKDPASDICRDR
ncbi:MAG: tail fiber domain-containing protein [Pyrinomonadaceae bacterium]